MRSRIDPSDLINIVGVMADTMEREKDYLSELDGAIGDGDHGVNMAKCFREVKKALPGLADRDVGGILKGAGMVILNSVGGAMGALYGTFFLRMAGVVEGKRLIDLDDLLKMFEAGEKGIMEIGKVQPGDKTLLDTIVPAVRALKKAHDEGKPLEEALADCVDGARQGAESTRAMVARIGRSSRLGERTIGHQDAGATSCYFMLRAFYDGVR